MFNPKTEIFQALSAISLDYTVMQGTQAEFNSTPAITYWIGDNSPEYDLSKAIAKQDIEVVVDVFADDSITVSRIVGEVEAAMREIDYLLTTSTDVPNPEGALYHANLRFSAVKIPNNS